MEITLDTSLSFDQAKQAAILGWALRDKLFGVQCARAVQPEWFSSPYVQKLYAAVVSLYNTHHRIVGPADLRQHRPFLQEDAKTQAKLEATLVEALQKTDVYGLDILRSEMTQWMHAVIFQQTMSKASTTYNAKKVEEAWDIVEAAARMKATGTFEDGLSQGFQDASVGVCEERAERLVQAPRVLTYGVKFLDDALGGIIPNDLIVLGAKTGAGKTGLATAISLHNVEAGNAVSYFALEAENYEIQRRIKYGMISQVYYKTKTREQPTISYTEWRMGRVDALLRPIEEQVEPYLQKALKNLKTLYRTSGDYRLKDLEKDLLDQVMTARLIVVDHLHYIDTDDDENAAYKRTVKLIRDIALRYSVPIVVVAHLRKDMPRRDPPLVPGIEDFHGTSDVPKTATTCIMIAPAGREYAKPEENGVVQHHLWPTFVRPVKCRLEGSRTRFTGLCYFNARTNRYTNNYRLGYLKSYDTEWDELIPGFAHVPEWAHPEAQAKV